MTKLIIGSARSDENHKIRGGKPGDQRQTSTEDYSGEVSMQDFYVHKKGWIILRAKSDKIAKALAVAMHDACNNANIGYDQDDRYGIMKYGTKSYKRINCDCSSLVRQCIKEATGKDVGDFDTSDEVEKIMSTGLFEKLTYSSGTKLYAGDILVTKTKGHTAIVISSPYTRNSDKPVIKKGYNDSKKGGHYCKELQVDLNRLGIRDKNNNKLETDGSCGSLTVSAIKNFQKKYGLKVDGHCGPKTWATIDNAIADLT